MFEVDIDPSRPSAEYLVGNRGTLAEEAVLPARPDADSKNVGGVDIEAYAGGDRRPVDDPLHHGIDVARLRGIRRRDRLTDGRQLMGEVAGQREDPGLRPPVGDGSGPSGVIGSGPFTSHYDNHLRLVVDDLTPYALDFGRIEGQGRTQTTDRPDASARDA
ncbi:hypothetical protein ACWGI1_23965 [Streptomyces sp. NPDC054835]